MTRTASPTHESSATSAQKAPVTSSTSVSITSAISRATFGTSTRISVASPRSRTSKSTSGTAVDTIPSPEGSPKALSSKKVSRSCAESIAHTDNRSSSPAYSPPSSHRDTTAERGPTKKVARRHPAGATTQAVSTFVACENASRSTARCGTGVSPTTRPWLRSSSTKGCLGSATSPSAYERSASASSSLISKTTPSSVSHALIMSPPVPSNRHHARLRSEDNTTLHASSSRADARDPPLPGTLH